MDDLFNQLMGNMGGFRSESRRYMINGREVTPEEFAIYRQTGQLPNEGSEQVQHHQGKGMKQDGILAKLGRNLTEEAREGKLDPVIGRNKEIQETAEILSRRTKNNPVLVGDAGVGKTAVVEGLAQAIVNGDVPAAIKNKEIISIDISGLEAGTQYRGSFEENIQNLIQSKLWEMLFSSLMKSIKSLVQVAQVMVKALKVLRISSNLLFHVGN